MYLVDGKGVRIPSTSAALAVDSFYNDGNDHVNSVVGGFIAMPIVVAFVANASDSR